MKTFYYSLMLGLAFTALQVGVVEAQMNSGSSMQGGNSMMNSGMLPTADDSARPIGEGGEGGGPAAQDMSGNMINDGGHGANSGKALDCDYRCTQEREEEAAAAKAAVAQANAEEAAAEKAKLVTKTQAISTCLSFHGANDDFTKQLCGDSYNECLSDSFRQQQGAASACDHMHGSPLK
jgi:hypothetical protein